MGSTKPSASQIQDFRARAGPAATQAATLTADELRLLTELEAGTASVTKSLLGLADRSGKTFDAVQKLGSTYGFDASSRSARPALSACGSARKAGPSAAAASSTLGSPIWGGLASGLQAGSLTIDPLDSVLSRLRQLVTTVAPGIALSSGPTALKSASGQVSGTIAVLFALFPALLGDDPATQAKVSAPTAPRAVCVVCLLVHAFVVLLTR